MATLFRTKRDAFRSDGLDVRNAHEAEHGTKITFRVLPMLNRRARAVDAATSDGQDDSPVAKKNFRRAI
nr:hypothetical protein [Chitinasiproducens palmae]